LLKKGVARKFHSLCFVCFIFWAFGLLFSNFSNFIVGALQLKNKDHKMSGLQKHVADLDAELEVRTSELKNCTQNVRLLEDRQRSSVGEVGKVPVSKGV
jgi:hypothetical protein